MGPKVLILIVVVVVILCQIRLTDALPQGNSFEKRVKRFSFTDCVKKTTGDSTDTVENAAAVAACGTSKRLQGSIPFWDLPETLKDVITGSKNPANQIHPVLGDVVEFTGVLSRRADAAIKVGTMAVTNMGKVATEEALNTFKDVINWVG